LRWDHRSGRRQGAKPFDKGKIADFEFAILTKLAEIADDLNDQRMSLDLFAEEFKTKGNIQLLSGSSLELLPTIQFSYFDGIITSPPYCNRYDYTRTYALELALLGTSETQIREMRQAMLSCTVENREKQELAQIFTPLLYEQARSAFEEQRELQAILHYLDMLRLARTINNPGIPRMVRNYFLEMALIIFECYRVLKPGSPLVMVNDNVRYGGAIIPVDLILSDFAEKAGFYVEKIWILPSGKGNSSQQMGLHGREELRKCVYIWRR
jgi:DNA modification methylase